jgi:DNA adenine methylase
VGYSIQFNTPLRYPGGKRKLTDFIKLVFEQNGLLDGEYAEPYAGGAAIAMTLLVHSYAARVHLNDIDYGVHAFWRSMVDEPEAFMQKIRDTRITMAEWRRQRAIHQDARNHTPLQVGFATFFLNRTNRSGIIWGGVIGGKNQTGPWKINARFVKKDLIKRIEKIALYRSRIRLYNQDARQFIKGTLPTLPTKALVYLDPPYYVKGGELYENHYQHADHVQIAQLVTTQIKQPWIVSYDHAPAIQKLYRRWRYKGAELMFFSPKLVIPDVRNPARLKEAA